MVHCGCLTTTLLAVVINVSAATAVAVELPPALCHINSMCQCQSQEFSCFSVPLHKLPEWPSLFIQSMDVTGANIRELEEDALDGLRLTSFTFVANKLNHIAKNAFSSSMSTLLTLDLGFNDLTDVPLKTLQNLNVLFWINLQNNNIGTITGNWSRLRESLISMSLSNNDLTHITSSSLAQLSHLSRIDLDGNRLKSLASPSLPSNLIEIQASRNLIESFPCSALQNLSHLKNLILRDNFIKYLPQCPSNFTKSLEKLDISDNFITRMDINIFNSSLRVRNIDVSLNFLTNLPSAAFLNLKSLKIILAQNQIKNIAYDAFLGLEDCLEYLDLDNNNLRVLPNSLFMLVSLKHLSLGSNQLMHLPRLPPNIETLILSSNLFYDIPTKVLQNLKPSNLRHLDLSYNLINYLQSEHFSLWGDNLTTLLLKGNRITQLDEFIFSNLRALKKVCLSFNDIYHIHEHAFTNISTDLTVLEMSSAMHIEEFPTAVFSNLISLVWLSLDNNNYQIIDSLAFQSFSQLQYLNLDSNQLTYIPNFVFNRKVLKRLRDLRLSNNNIESIESHTFENIPEIKTIDLSGNNLKNISMFSFQNMGKLAFLSLANNAITNVEKNAFQNLRNLVVLELQNNLLETFSLGILRNVSNIASSFTLNISYNQITELSATEEATIEVFDCSHNKLKLSIEYFLYFVSKSLRKLFITNNQITTLDSDAFANLSRLEILKLSHNQLQRIHRRAFADLQLIQIIDLSHNKIDHFSSQQFLNLRYLRHLTIDTNQLSSLPRFVFRNTILEYLDLSKNNFKTFPNLALSQVGFTLRYLDLSSNELTYLDSTLFQDTPYLTEIYLSNNRISELPDNSFVSLPKVRVLDLSWNNLRTNVKELLHSLPNLNNLNMSGVGMQGLPYLALFNLTVLDLSSNFLEDLRFDSIRNLTNLRSLNLSKNRLQRIPTQAWHYLKYLKTLDISRNPIKSISSDSFVGLRRLKKLNIDNLYNLNRFDRNSLSPLSVLSKLYIQVPSNLKEFHLDKIVSYIPSLNKISIHIIEENLEKQLVGIFNPKLRSIEITGQNLKTIHPEAFSGSERNKELAVSIRNTSISELPLGLFDHLGKVAYLSMDLSNNKLVSLSPAVLYPNTTSWNKVATKLIAGGLLLNNNPLECHCELAWIGGWLRRWLRESIEVGNAPVPVSRVVHDAVRVATCIHPLTGKAIPLVQLRPEDNDCYASALASAATKTLHSTIVLCCILSLFVLQRDGWFFANAVR